jgi:hypothetical protein
MSRRAARDAVRDRSGHILKTDIIARFLQSPSRRTARHSLASVGQPFEVGTQVLSPFLVRPGAVAGVERFRKSAGPGFDSTASVTAWGTRNGTVAQDVTLLLRAGDTPGLAGSRCCLVMKLS